MCERIHARCLSYEEKRGMPGRQTPCEIAWSGVNSFIASSWDRGTICFVCETGAGSTWIAEGAMVGVVKFVDV
jgi:hypothetical protein